MGVPIVKRSRNSGAALERVVCGSVRYWSRCSANLVALLLDGKTFAEDEMVTAVGVTITGDKVLLGFVQTATENRKVCAAFLRELVERGLKIEAGLLVVTDGATACTRRGVRSAGPRRCCNAANGTSRAATRVISTMALCTVEHRRDASLDTL